jgi:hypothetical protein
MQLSAQKRKGEALRTSVQMHLFPDIVKGLLRMPVVVAIEDGCKRLQSTAVDLTISSSIPMTSPVNVTSEPVTMMALFAFYVDWPPSLSHTKVVFGDPEAVPL